jgi:hypothetical protein
MFKFIALAALALSITAHANDPFALLKSIGPAYNKVQGPCSSVMDNMKWFDFDQSGLLSLANTDRLNIRPLTGYSRNITISARNLKPVGEGEFKSVSNQPVPVKVEFEISADDVLTIYVHHKGKGSMGGIFTDFPGFSGANEKFIFTFSHKNENGIYEKMDSQYQDLKGLFNGKKQNCSFDLNK